MKQKENARIAFKIVSDITSFKSASENIQKSSFSGSLWDCFGKTVLVPSTKSLGLGDYLYLREVLLEKERFIT